MAYEFDDGISSGLEYERTGLDAPTAPAARGGIVARTAVPEAPPAGRKEVPAGGDGPERRDDGRPAAVGVSSSPRPPPPAASPSSERLSV